jgi:hypothetical protein
MVYLDGIFYAYMTARCKSILIWSGKVLIFIAAWAYVIYKFATMDQDFLLLFNDDHFSLLVLSLVCMLMFLNWGLEAIKWHFLVSKQQLISYFTAVKGVLIGLPLALVTPNRIGEIGGRAIVLKQHYEQGVFATFVGSFMQLITTLLFGAFGFLLYTFASLQYDSINMLFYVALGCLALCIPFVFLLLFIGKRHVVRLLYLQLVGKRWYRKTKQMLLVYAKGDRGKALIISIARYCVFGGQYALLMKMFLPELSCVQLIVGITLTYFFTTVIPTTVLGEVGIRGAVAMEIFARYTPNASVVFQVSMLLWVINIVFPTLLGSILLLAKKRKKE